MNTLSRERLAPAFRLFFPIAVAITLALGAAYVNGQQILRLSTNVPQIGMADQAAAAVAGGELPAAAAGPERVAIESSAAPYIVFYDTNGTPIAGSGYLNGALPQVPLGIFDVARAQGSDVLTWQPQKGVRQAIVVKPVQDPSGTGAAFVLSGRSLAYTEHQVDLMGLRMLLSWLVALTATFVACALVARRSH